MQQFLHALTFTLLVLLTACSGGGGGGGSNPPPEEPNDPPTAVADDVTVVENTPTQLSIFSNDDDPDGQVSTASIGTQPAHGTVIVNGSQVTYTPDDGYTGDDSFTYAAVDNDGAASDAVTVSITVTPITETTLTVNSRSIPASGYTQQNHAEFQATVLTSPAQSLTVPANTVSFLLQLQGDDAGISPHSPNLFFSGMDNAAGLPLSPFFRHVLFCDSGLCTALVPRRPDISAERGDWAYYLGTFENTLGNIDLSNLSLNVTVRTGPQPDTSATFPAKLKVHPFMTADSITEVELQTVLDEFTRIANDNNITIDMDPITVVSGDQYNEVSGDFNDSITAELVTMGDAGKVNIFFLEGFTGASGGGTLGISGGLPGPLGLKNNFNGILINATATHSAPSIYARTTAEFAFHEMGHFLGLFHTTERTFGFNDIIDDTPNCSETDDTNNNGIANVEECADGLNPMFWDNDFNQAKETLTGDQKHVLFYSPIATP
ncbi:MAG: cadherin-like domain-containing protein [Pseudomonadales bacterium]|nr:cadherin-like domain-containing protein [Pseudomonadales bacterium]